MSQVMTASKQWAQRPDSERCWSLGEMKSAAEEIRLRSAEADIPGGQVWFSADRGNLVAYLGPGETTVSHFAFTQLAGKVGAPSGFLRELNAETAARVLNERMGSVLPDAERRALLWIPQDSEEQRPLLRALTSVEYRRLWNADVLNWVGSLPGEWKAPPAKPMNTTRQRPATLEDVEGLPTSIQVGDMIGPAGYYLSDRDCFVFLVAKDWHVGIGQGRALTRAVMIWNMELYGASSGLDAFLFDHVCGNHILWDAQKVGSIRLRHIGEVQSRAPKALASYVRGLLSVGTTETYEGILAAQRHILGADKEKVVQQVYADVGGLSKKVIEQGFDEGQKAGWDPLSAWSMVQGLSTISQMITEHADDRTHIDRAAGKVMELAAPRR